MHTLGTCRATNEFIVGNTGLTAYDTRGHREQFSLRQQSLEEAYDLYLMRWPLDDAVTADGDSADTKEYFRVSHRRSL